MTKHRPTIMAAVQARLYRLVVRLVVPLVVRCGLGWITLCFGVALVACQSNDAIVVGRDTLGPCGVMGLQREAQLWLQPLNASSPWLHPWKAYQDMWTGQRLRQAAGVQLSRAQSQALATLGPRLKAAGFGRVSMGVPWSSIRLDRPELLTESAIATWTNVFTAAKANNLRPILHLGGDFGRSLPLEALTLTLLEAAPAGARSVRLDAASAQLVVNGRTGFDDGGAPAGLLITSVDPDGVAQLARPTGAPMEAGPREASTLRYAPFTSPRLANGQPNPTFESTLAGYISFVKAVSSLATAVLGEDGFDIVLWGARWSSYFLSAKNYYDPFMEAGAGMVSEDVPVAILNRTALALREARMLTFALGDGFVDVTSLAAENAAKEPEGSTALVRRSFVQTMRLPAEWGRGSFPMLDAQGQLSGTRDAAGVWVPNFVPSLRALFPEHSLTALFESNTRPGQMIRDLSPLVTDRGSSGQHGRNVLNQGGQRVALWLDPAGITLTDTDAEGITDLQQERLFAKVAMRTLTAFVGKGTAAVALTPLRSGHDIFASQSNTGGLQTVARFLQRFDGEARGPTLWFTQVQSCSTSRQFAGDGSTAHPDLLNRDVVMVAPFRVSPSRVVVAAYVMTYDLLSENGAQTDEAQRFDLAPEPYQLSFAGQGAHTASVQVYDPLNDADVPAQVVARNRSTLTVEVPLTDSPRLITFEGF